MGNPHNQRRESLNDRFVAIVLQRINERYGGSQEACATAAGVNQSTLSRNVSAEPSKRTLPTLKTLTGLAIALGLDVPYLQALAYGGTVPAPTSSSHRHAADPIVADIATILTAMPPAERDALHVVLEHVIDRYRHYLEPRRQRPAHKRIAS